MSKIILLAADAEHDALEAARAARDLCAAGDRILVLHVHEFAVGRFGRLQVDCGAGEGEHVVASLAASLRDSGIAADSEIREARVGHVARAILAAADDIGAAAIVVGSAGRHDLPLIPLGSVSHKLLHLAQRPVMVVPRGATGAAGQDAARQAHAEPATAGPSATEPVPG